MAVRMQARLVADVTGDLNPALVDFTFRSTLGASDPELTAAVVQYLALNGWGIMGNVVSLVSVRKIIPGVDGYTEMDYPADEVQAIKDLLVSATGAWDDANVWGDTITGGASGGSSGRGDSLCVTTLTGQAGRSGVGKHFLPYISRDVVDSGGLYDVTTRSVIENRYRAMFMGVTAGITTSPAVQCLPAVYSTKNTADYLVTTPRVSQVPSRLRSRTK